jgi:hypothetical protein
MAGQKIILLDVDDVILMDDLRTDDNEAPGVRHVVGYIHDELRHQRAWVNDVVLTGLRNLPAEVEIRWASSWLAAEPRQLQRLAGSLGLDRAETPDLGGIKPSRYGMVGSWQDIAHWKTALMKMTVYQNPGVPLLWIDDHLTFSFVRNLQHPELSMIAPIRGRGLTVDDVEQITLWADNGAPFLQLGDDAPRNLPLEN